MSKKSETRKRIIICADMSSKVSRERLSGILRYAGAHPDWTIHIVSGEDQLEQGPVALVSTLEPDGMIFIRGITPKNNGHVDPAPARRKCKFPVPVIFFEPLSQRLGFKPDAELDVDDAEIARSAYQIFERAHPQSVGYVGNGHEREQTHSAHRKAAFSRLAKEAGIPFRAFDLNTSENWASQLTALANWLSNLPHPCGVFSYSDAIAKTTIDACNLTHLNIPEQILLVGVDNDTSICENMHPTLSSIEPDFEGAGFMAAALLGDILSGSRPRKTIYRSYGVKAVIERTSSQDLSGSRRIVAAALDLIRKEAPTPKRFNVKDLCHRLNVSRSLLEKMFRTTLDCGVAERIRLVRLDALSSLLIKTDKPIAELSHLCGFSSPTHIKTLFKRHFGCTMRAWRKQLSVPI